jgi:hypothetical protein
VATDITNAILKMHATNEKGAEYWSKTEQEEKLVAAFNKWARKGTVWSAAAQKVRLRGNISDIHSFLRVCKGASGTAQTCLQGLPHTSSTRYPL